MQLERFTLIGATTRFGLLTPPMRARFGLVERLHYYPPDDLVQIVKRSARLLAVEIDEDGAEEIARRSRGTPRIANRRLSWARSYAASEADGTITLDVARAALSISDVDGEGLDKQDRRYLETLIGVFAGGPTGVEALAATMNLPTDTLSDDIEPYLLRQQFIVRTPRGRLATDRSYQLLGKERKSLPDESGTLFE